MSSQQHRGFTLIEVMVAIAITAIVAVMAYAGLDNATRLAESSEKQVERLQQINRVFDIINRDFRQLVPRVVRNPDGYGFDHAFSYSENAIPMLQLSRNGWTNPQPERFQRSQLQRVSYHYDGDKLLRTGWQMMDHYADDEATEIALLEGVKSFRIRVLVEVFNPTTQAPVAEWMDQWPGLTMTSGASAALPLSVELTIELADWGEIRRVFAVPRNDG